MSEPSTAESNAPEPVKPARDTPGAKLEAERRRQGLSIPDVARHLKLAPRQVEALENDQYNALPGVVFVRGFMRNYARALNLDPEPLVRAAEQSLAVSANELPMSGPTTIGKPTMHDSGSSHRGGRMPSWIPGLVVAALLAVGIGYFVFGEFFQRTTELPPASQSVSPPAATVTEPNTAPHASTTAAVPVAPPAVTDPAAVAGAANPATASTTPPPVAATTPAAPAVAPSAEPAPPATDPSKPELRFSFTKQSWVEIRDRTNKVIFSKPTDPGGERVVQGTPPFKVKIGNSSGVKLNYNGKDIDLKPHRRTNDVAYVVLE